MRLEASGIPLPDSVFLGVYSPQLGDVIQTVWESPSELDKREFYIKRGNESSAPVVFRIGQVKVAQTAKLVVTGILKKFRSNCSISTSAFKMSMLSFRLQPSA